MRKREHPVILIVDDHKDIRELLTAVLQHQEYKLIEAFNGEDAITMSEREHPDLILMDLQMPIVDGLHAAQQIRQHVHSRETPIIFMTAFGGEGMELFMQIDSLGSAPIEYLPKPLDLQEVKTVVARLLTRD